GLAGQCQADEEASRYTGATGHHQREEGGLQGPGAAPGEGVQEGARSVGGFTEGPTRGPEGGEPAEPREPGGGSSEAEAVPRNDETPGPEDGRAEAMQMMTEMRKAHIQEVRLLQRGLAARGNGEMRNKVNEVADLVDKLGRAVLQRDENLREKSKAQVRLGKVEGDLRAITEECTRLKRQNKSLNDQLKEAQRKARFTPPRVDGAPEDSDEEFEHELLAFEQRFTILEEGPAGLDILASNLSKDKQGLEKRLKQSQETVGSLTSSVAEWKRLSEEQDLQIADLNTKLDQMMRDHAAMQEAIAQKRREIEQQVAEEKAQLEAKVVELQLECDNARAVSDGMDKASNRVQKELTKAQDAFTAAQQKRAEAHGAPAETEPDPSGAGGGAPAAAPEAAAGEAPSAEPGSAEPGSAEPSSAEPGSAEGAQPQPAEPATTGAPTEPAASAPEEAPGEVLGEGRGNEGGAG
ncbi:unnamed protein product, partial [Effrenium voratum]